MRRPAYRVLHIAPPGIQGATYACNICYVYILHNATRVGRNPKLRAYSLLLTCLHAYMLTCLHAYMLTCLPTCMFTYSHAYMLICLNVGMIHAYMLACFPRWRRTLPKVKMKLAKVPMNYPIT